MAKNMAPCFKVNVFLTKCSPSSDVFMMYLNGSRIVQECISEIGEHYSLDCPLSSNSQ